MHQNIERTVLSNGVTVITDPMVDVGTVALEAAFTVGSRHESAEQSGIAHLVEHMLFRGTSTRTGEDIAREVDDMGGLINAWTGREMLSVDLSLAADDAMKGVSIVADMVRRSRFPADLFDIERDVVLQEIRDAADQPAQLGEDAYYLACFGDTPLGRTGLGSVDTVSALVRGQLVQFASRHLTADRLILSFSGRISHTSAVTIAQAQFGDMPRGSGASTFDPHPFRAGAETRITSTEQVYVEIGFEAPAYENRRGYDATWLLSSLLGGGMSSRLWQEVREKRGLAYQIGTEYSPFCGAGVFGISAVTSPKQLVPLVQVVLDQLRAVMLTPPGEAELKRLKRSVQVAGLRHLESPRRRADFNARNAAVWGHPLTISEVNALSESFQADDLCSLASEVFSRRPAVSIVGPVRDNCAQAVQELI